MGKYFGTDGFRGEANKNLTSLQAYKIGRYLGSHFSRDGKKARIAIGKDTRLSSYMFEYSIAAGLTASGADAYMLHVTTTPSVSYAVIQDDFDCGIMISASHNPYYDNGIKLINGKGEKMEELLLCKIEDYLDCENDDLPYATGENIGRIVDHVVGRNRYVGYLISLSRHSYKNIRIGLDCANGSAWMIAKNVFDALGAKTYVINAEPDGININRDAGSTHIEGLCEYVRQKNLDIGFAFDGDADRCLAVDENGREVTGDHLLYIFGRAMKKEGTLSSNTVVTTVMSNLGLYRALEKAGIDYVQTNVGDKYVYESMTENGYCVGGEQSGHIILSRYATAGDGILTAIQLMNVMLDAKEKLSTLASPVSFFPQITKNIRVDDKKAVRENKAVLDKVEEIRLALGDCGRILLRESGTEPLIRVMVESETKEHCSDLAESVLSVIRKEGLAK